MSLTLRYIQPILVIIIQAVRTMLFLHTEESGVSSTTRTAVRRRHAVGNGHDCGSACIRNRADDISWYKVQLKSHIISLLRQVQP